jgi:hypothetical protein
METKNSTKNNDNYFDSESTANKNFKTGTSALLDAYKKQMELMSDLYSNMFNSFSNQNRNIWNPVKDYADLFWNNADLKYPRMPFSNFSNGNAANPFSISFDKIFRQISDQNQNLVDSFAKQFEEWTSNLNNLNGKYRQLVEKRMEISKEMLDASIDSYHKQVEFAVESNKKLAQELAEQANVLFRANQKFWTDITSTPEEGSTNSETVFKNGEQKNFKKTTKADSVF